MHWPFKTCSHFGTFPLLGPANQTHHSVNVQVDAKQCGLQTKNSQMDFYSARNISSEMGLIAFFYVHLVLLGFVEGLYMCWMDDKAKSLAANALCITAFVLQTLLLQTQY